MLPRVLQVVDVYDALRTARSYKPALTHEQAANHARGSARGLWDDELVDEYFSMLEQNARSRKVHCVLRPNPQFCLTLSAALVREPRWTRLSSST